MKIILASQSPRRKELLAQMGVDFDVVPSNFDEKLDNNRTPQEVAEELALGKASEVAKQFPDAIVIGSDTIVEVDGVQLEKPINKADAKRLLTLLSDKPNNVITSLAVICQTKNYSYVASDTAKVYFKPFNELAIDEYIATGDPMDKAGAYGIQSGAAPLISHISGNYDTIIGLPTIQLAKVLRELGIQSEPVYIVPPVPEI